MLIKDAIRKEIADIISSSPYVQCASIWESKNFNSSPSDMPAVVIDTPREKWNDFGLRGPLYNSTVSIFIMIVAPAIDGSKKATENIAKQILTELFERTEWRNQFMGGIEIDINDDIQDEGEYSFFSTTIQFDVTVGMESEVIISNNLSEIAIEAAPIGVYKIIEGVDGEGSPTFKVNLIFEEGKKDEE